MLGSAPRVVKGEERRGGRAVWAVLEVYVSLDLEGFVVVQVEDEVRKLEDVRL